MTNDENYQYQTVADAIRYLKSMAGPYRPKRFIVTSAREKYPTNRGVKKFLINTPPGICDLEDPAAR